MGYCSFCKMDSPGNGACMFCGKRNTIGSTSASSTVRTQINGNRNSRNQSAQNFQRALDQTNTSIREMQRTSRRGRRKRNALGGRLLISIILGLLIASVMGSSSTVFWIVTILVFIFSK